MFERNVAARSVARLARSVENTRCRRSERLVIKPCPGRAELAQGLSDNAAPLLELTEIAIALDVRSSRASAFG